MVLQIITVLWKIFKKSGENKNKLRTYTLKIMKILKIASLGSSFTGSYKKKECNMFVIVPIFSSVILVKFIIKKGFTLK